MYQGNHVRDPAVVIGNAERARLPRAPINRAPVNGGDRLSRAECLEIICAAASIGVGDCPTWVILALERSELPHSGLGMGGNLVEQSI